MKTKIFASIFPLLCSVSIVAQGTIEFRTNLDSLHAIPPTSSIWTGVGLFSLDLDGAFSGSMGVNFIVGQDPILGAVAIYTSSSPNLLGTPVYEFTFGGIVVGDPIQGIPDGQQFHFSRTLNASERNDLLSGDWWVNVAAPGLTTVRGQILQVPEPTTVALFCSVAGILWLQLHKRR